MILMRRSSLKRAKAKVPALKAVGNKIWVVLFAFTGAVASQNSAKYPNNPVLESPDHKYTIINSDDMSGNEPQHYLYLVSRSPYKKSLLFRYGRSVQVFWCPTSTCVVINDFEGSNVSSVYRLNVDSQRSSLDLGDLLLTWMKNHGQERVSSSCLHLYAYATEITSDGDIKLVLTGDNGIDSQGFTRIFAYKNNGELTLVQATNKYDGLE